MRAGVAHKWIIHFSTTGYRDKKHFYDSPPQAATLQLGLFVGNHINTERPRVIMVVPHELVSQPRSVLHHCLADCDVWDPTTQVYRVISILVAEKRHSSIFILLCCWPDSVHDIHRTGIILQSCAQKKPRWSRL